MRVLLVSPNTETVNMPVYPVGMHLVADAARQSGHEVATLDMFEHSEPWRALEDALARSEPEAVGISVRNIDDQSLRDTRFFLDGTREVVRRVRELTSAPVILGGAGYSIYPDSALDHLGADMGLTGEGEIALPALLQALQGNRSFADVPGLHYRGRGVSNPSRLIRHLDDAPLPRPEWVTPERMRREDFWMPYQTRRGCPLDCSYCSTGGIEGRPIRKRSIPEVASNLETLCRAGIRRFFFTDNTFNLPAGYAKGLCRTIMDKDLEMDWCAIIYPLGVDRELADLMAGAGCRQVSLGFESGSAPVLSALNKRFTRSDVRRASEELARAGIRRMGFLLLGGPGETEATVRESLDFAESLELDALQITAGIRIYPGTLLAKQAVRAGLIRPDDSLLRPRFYLEPRLAEWLPSFVNAWAAKRPGLVLD